MYMLLKDIYIYILDVFQKILKGQLYLHATTVDPPMQSKLLHQRNGSPSSFWKTEALPNTF